MFPGESRTSGAGQARFVANAQSDDRGHYELPFLPPGEYRLRVQAQPWYASGVQGGPRMGASLVSVAGGSGGRATPASPVPGSPDPSLDLVYLVTWYPAADSQAAAETIRLAGGEEREADFHLTAIPASHLIIARPDTGPPAEPSGGRQRPAEARDDHPRVVRWLLRTDQLYRRKRPRVGLRRAGAWNLRGPPARSGRRERWRDPADRGAARRGLAWSRWKTPKPLTRVQISVEGLSESESASVEFTDVETGPPDPRQPPAAATERPRRRRKRR